MNKAVGRLNAEEGIPKSTIMRIEHAWCLINKCFQNEESWAEEGGKEWQTQEEGAGHANPI